MEKNVMRAKVFLSRAAGSVNLAPLLERYEEQHASLNAIFTTCDAGVTHAMTALVEVERCLAGLPSWIPHGVAILDVEITATIVHRHIVVAITRDATELGILVETVTSSSVGNQ